MKHNTLHLVQALLATVLLACGLNAAANRVSPLLDDHNITENRQQLAERMCKAR